MKNTIVRVVDKTLNDIECFFIHDNATDIDIIDAVNLRSEIKDAWKALIVYRVETTQQYSILRIQ